MSPNSHSPPRLARYRRKAERDLHDPERVDEVTRRAGAKLDRYRDRLGDLREDFPVLLRLARAWVRKEYRSVPWKSLVSVVAALLYFVAPVDLIPDFVPVLGFVDDAALVAYVVRSIRADLQAFEKWEDEALPAD